MYKVKIPDDIKTVKDPHHGGFNEWCLYYGRYYIRTECSAKWQEVKKVHPTPARISALATLNKE